MATVKLVKQTRHVMTMTNHFTNVVIAGPILGLSRASNWTSVSVSQQSIYGFSAPAKVAASDVFIKEISAFRGTYYEG